MPKDDQNFWNFIFTLFFAVLFGFATYYLWQVGAFPTRVNFFDVALITLATFRLTRLFVYDKIMQFVRDWFLNKAVSVGDEGELLIVRSKPVDGPFRTISELLSCPWCIGMWAALVVSFFYFLTPYAWFPIFVLAISSLGTLFQLFANMLGWRAEALKVSVEGHGTSDSNSLPR